MKTLNIGIIGAGRMGNAHAENLAKLGNAAVTAVYDIDPAKAAAFVGKYPGVAVKNSAEELVNAPEVELIVITSPTYCHKEGLLPAMATGKPIFCEKPLCRTQEEVVKALTEADGPAYQKALDQYFDAIGLAEGPDSAERVYQYLQKNAPFPRDAVIGRKRRVGA